MIKWFKKEIRECWVTLLQAFFIVSLVDALGLDIINGYWWVLITIWSVLTGVGNAWAVHIYKTKEEAKYDR